VLGQLADRDTVQIFLIDPDGARVECSFLRLRARLSFARFSGREMQ
jgi:hypothetical protein